MNIIKRIFLYLATNLLIVTTISVVLNALNLNSHVTAAGLDYKTLAATCLVWGMTGSLVALLLSRWTAKVVMKVSLVDDNERVLNKRQLVQSVRSLARRAGLGVMPEVGVYPSSEINAFATGATRNRSLVAVSSGLLDQMSADEIEGVLGHEISHIANGDMVTMTLLQGLINAFSLFLSRVFAHAIYATIYRNSKDRGYSASVTYRVLITLFDITVTFLGSIVTARYSRYREYRADQGGAHLAGTEKMIAALQRLGTVSAPEAENVDAFAFLKIQKKGNLLLSLLASHPDISLRIAALKRPSKYKGKL